MVLVEVAMIKWKGPQGPWMPYYTWEPRKINGRWYWFTTVYRRERNPLAWPHQGYEFGDGFDLLRDA
jgi:hypothetical protein